MKLNFTSSSLTAAEIAGIDLGPGPLPRASAFAPAVSIADGY